MLGPTGQFMKPVRMAGYTTDPELPPAGGEKGIPPPVAGRRSETLLLELHFALHVCNMICNITGG